MNKKLVTILLFISAAGLIGSYFGYQALKKRDFDLICEAYKKALQQKSNQSDPVTVAYQLAKTMESSLVTPPAKQTVTGISNADAADQYDLYRRSAEELGYSSWDCPAIKEFLK